MSEYVISRRWVTVATFALLAAWSAAAGVWALSEPRSSMFTVAVNFVIVGWCVSHIMWQLVLPGLFRGMKEADRAIMQDHLQREFDRAWEAFLRTHPEAAPHHTAGRMN